jgi:hypothetical protein
MTGSWSAPNSTLTRHTGLQPGQGLQRGTRIRPVSPKRQQETRERAAMADRLWPDRREGTVMCQCGRPGCHRRATDLHEPRFRSRLGAITDPDNAIPVARECHDWIHTHEQEAQELGLAVHTWVAKGGAA